MEIPDAIEQRTAGFAQYVELHNALTAGEFDPASAEPLFDELSGYLEGHRARFVELLSHCPDFLVKPFRRIRDALGELTEIVEDTRAQLGAGRLDEDLLDRAWKAESELRSGRDLVIRLHLQTSGEDLNSQFAL